MNTQPNVDHLIECIVARATTIRLETECAGLNLNEVGIHGRTPLMVAAAEGFFAAVETLVRHGASVHATGDRQMTALHEASASGKAAIATYLLSLGAEVDAETTDGVTPLMCAAAWGNNAVARTLLDNGADWKRVDRTGATAADIAREKGEDDAAALIESYSTQSRSRDSE